MKLVLAALTLLAIPIFASAAACSASSTSLAFGVYLPSSVSKTQSSSAVSVTCLYVLGLLGSNVNYTIALGAGSSGGGTFATRKMRSGGDALAYQLYADSVQSQVWGDGTGGSTTMSGTCTFLVINLACTSSQTVRGALPAGQWAAPGTYGDTVMVTISY